MHWKHTVVFLKTPTSSCSGYSAVICSTLSISSSSPDRIRWSQLTASCLTDSSAIITHINNPLLNQTWDLRTVKFVRNAQLQQKADFYSLLHSYKDCHWCRLSLPNLDKQLSSLQLHFSWLDGLYNSTEQPLLDWKQFSKWKTVNIKLLDWYFGDLFPYTERSVV